MGRAWVQSFRLPSGGFQSWRGNKAGLQNHLATGKIYIGKDSVGSARTMGRPDMDLAKAEFARLSSEVRRDYWVRKEILWESIDATETELSAKEVELIRQYRSNDPEVGYNRRPRFTLNGGDGMGAQGVMAE
jgi:hypothetical protein